MKKHGRPIFGITKRTRFAAAMVVVAVVLVLAIVVLGYVGVFGLRSELCEVSATPDKADDTYGGTGINCDVIPNINLVRDASFESSTQYSSMLVAGASENSVFLTPDAVASAGYDTTNCAGDTARIISIDSEGVMSEKFTGIVTGYKPAKLGAVSLIKDEKSLWDEDRIKEMAFYGNTALALTDSGRLIYDLTNSQLTGVVNAKDRFALIDSNDSGVVAVATDGTIYYSQDGKNFSSVYEPENLTLGQKVCGIGSSGQISVVCYKDGTVVTVAAGNIAQSNLPGYDATSFVSDGKRFLATDSRGNVYSSTNGMVFENIGVSEMIKDKTNILTAATSGVFCFVSDNSNAVIVKSEDKDFRFEEIELAKATGSPVSSVYLTNSGLIIAGTTDDKAYAINIKTARTVNLTSENVVVENIIGVNGDKVYYDSGKGIYKSQILSELSLEGNLEGIDIIADDILVAGHLGRAAGGVISSSDSRDYAWSVSDDSTWAVYGKGTNVITTDRAYSGKYGARITGSGSDVHALTQTLPGKAKDNFMPGTFYRLSLYVMSDKAPEKAFCWLEGEGFGKYGIELTGVGKNYKLYSYVFAVTDQMADAEEVRLSIAFEGTGFILVDDVFLGPDSYSTAGVPQYYADTLKSGKPAAMRLNNLNIGCNGFAETSMYLSSIDSVSRDISGTSSRTEYSNENSSIFDKQNQSVTVSLEDSLRLVKQCSSTPWFVIGPYVNQDDIDKLLEYLCGSLTSEYGGRRIDNGTALPWSRQFSRFYIEINDSGKVFKSDIQKASYVNYVKSMFTQSEYFSDIKDKTFFLDGMEYSGGTMMSDADYHTMDVSLIANDTSATYIDNIRTSYILAQYEAPHVISGAKSGEYIKTLKTSGTNCGKIISAIITSEADFADMILFDASVNFVPSKYAGSEMFIGKEEFVNMMTVSGITTVFAGFDELYIDIKEPLDTSVPVSVEQFMSNVTTACFSKGNKAYIVVANSSSVQQSFLINDNKLGRSDSVIRRYDDKGRLINEKKMRSDHLRHILQPGEFIIVEVDLK
ncbi:hypothetical protein B0O40_0096 [Ruminococcaceae bacterium R-25]|nr:hypothetical protein B0O40_0096 [Ruminococcaceae bacterium R-25]SUQ10745.1 hypothetical protein SAMN06297423_0096 [Oscillospiraceae bacterium]